MERVLKRIALHGLLTALALGAIGALFTQLAAFWLASAAPARVTPVDSPAADPVDKAIRYRVPLTMAAWGFAFVVVSELLVFAVRGEKKPAAQPPKDDTAEKLLEELLSQADIALAKEKESGDRGQESGVRSQESGDKKPTDGDTQHAASILTPDP